VILAVGMETHAVQLTEPRHLHPLLESCSVLHCAGPSGGDEAETRRKGSDGLEEGADCRPNAYGRTRGRNAEAIIVTLTVTQNVTRLNPVLPPRCLSRTPGPVNLAAAAAFTPRFSNGPCDPGQNRRIELRRTQTRLGVDWKTTRSHGDRS